MPTATQVADWIVHFRHDDLAAPVDPMSLVKLTYYAQCFYLARSGRVLFEEDVRAWRHGPVIRSVYDQYREFGAHPIIPTDGGIALDGEVEEFLSDLVMFFGACNAIQLSKATHAEEPWIFARRGYNRQDNSDVSMPPDRLRSYYSSLISDGEQALSRRGVLDVLPEPRWAHQYMAGISHRLMFDHPLYRPDLAKKFAPLEPDSEPGPEGTVLTHESRAAFMRALNSTEPTVELTGLMALISK